jgi:hypothetical protein
MDEDGVLHVGPWRSGEEVDDDGEVGRVVVQRRYLMWMKK